MGYGGGGERWLIQAVFWRRNFGIFPGQEGSSQHQSTAQVTPCLHTSERASVSLWRRKGKPEGKLGFLHLFFWWGAGGDENKLSLDQKVTVLGLQGKVFTGAASLEAIGGAHQNRNSSAILLLKMYPSGILAHVHKNLSTKIFTVNLS